MSCTLTLQLTAATALRAIAELNRDVNCRCPHGGFGASISDPGPTGGDRKRPAASDCFADIMMSARPRRCHLKVGLLFEFRRHAFDGVLYLFPGFIQVNLKLRPCALVGAL